MFTDIKIILNIYNKKNGGVSSARNLGIEYSDRKYMNLKKYDKYINIVECPLYFFEAV